MKIHLSRFICGEVVSNLEALESETGQASLSGADLCVFPESFLHGYTRGADSLEVRKRFAALSSRHSRMALIFGSFTEDRRNRMTLWLGGEEIARYDKVHLFEPNHEARLWDPGDRYIAARFGDWTLGLVNCNDIRFPEQSRALRLQGGCDLLVVVGWWPWRRDHVWRTLLRARAMENGIFTAGCCISASRYPGEDFDGAGNYVFDPVGDPIVTCDDLTYDLDRKRLEAVIVDPRKTYIDIQRVESH
jgi:deaminated glutathione amidase